MSDRTDDAREVLEHRDDVDEWSEEPEDIVVRTGPSEVVSFRVRASELDSLLEGAEERGETLSEYIRGAIALRMHGQPIGPAVEISSGATRLTIRSHIVLGGGREATDSIVQDFPPLTQTAL